MGGGVVCGPCATVACAHALPLTPASMLPAQGQAALSDVSACFLHLVITVLVSASEFEGIQEPGFLLVKVFKCLRKSGFWYCSLICRGDSGTLQSQFGT